MDDVTTLQTWCQVKLLAFSRGYVMTELLAAMREAGLPTVHATTASRGAQKGRECTEEAARFVLALATKPGYDESAAIALKGIACLQRGDGGGASVALQSSFEIRPYLESDHDAMREAQQMAAELVGLVESGAMDDLVVSALDRVCECVVGALAPSSESLKASVDALGAVVLKLKQPLNPRRIARAVVRQMGRVGGSPLLRIAASAAAALVGLAVFIGAQVATAGAPTLVLIGSVRGSPNSLGIYTPAPLDSLRMGTKADDEMPDAPFPGQIRDTEECYFGVKLKMGCWAKLAEPPPCKRGSFRYDRACYMAVYSIKRPPVVPHY